jgi:hypothetical protein
LTLLLPMVAEDYLEEEIIEDSGQRLPSARQFTEA